MLSWHSVPLMSVNLIKQVGLAFYACLRSRPTQLHLPDIVLQFLKTTPLHAAFVFDGGNARHEFLACLRAILSVVGTILTALS